MINVKNQQEIWDALHESAGARVLVGVPHEAIVPDQTLVWAWQEMTLMQEHIEKQNEAIKELTAALKEAQSSSEAV